MSLRERVQEKLLGLGAAVCGLVCGAVTLLILNLCLLWLSGLLPLRHPWPARYYARFDYAELSVSALAAAATVRVSWRHSPAFAVGFGVASAMVVALGALMVADGDDGSWYIP